MSDSRKSESSVPVSSVLEIHLSVSKVSEFSMSEFKLSESNMLDSTASEFYVSESSVLESNVSGPVCQILLRVLYVRVSELECQS